MLGISAVCLAATDAPSAKRAERDRSCGCARGRESDPTTQLGLLGAFIGWIGSLVMRPKTSERILIDITTGALGALVLAILLTNSGTFDNLMAGYLAAAIAMAILHLARRTGRPQE